MRKSKRGGIWWWLSLIAVFVAVIVYFAISKIGERPEKKALITNAISPVETVGLPQQHPEATEEREDIPAGLTHERTSSEVPPKQDSCTQIEKNMADFFRYLDGKEYIQHLNPKMDIHTRFKKILKRLWSRPPIPAGEGVDPEMIIKNVYHFFRVLGRKDLRLIKEIINNEQDTVEENLKMLWRWLTLGDGCPDPEGLRPSTDILYRYSGFLINTIGGRSYLFRRAPCLRLLVSYYCLTAISEADKAGKNRYGIDIFPYISPLKNEINHYPDFRFHIEYIERLSWIEDYYLQKR